MKSSLIIGGFGGQGIMLMGKLLGYTACEEGLEATFLPSYGPEQRGGTANCRVVISNGRIGSPIEPKTDVLIAMNEPSLLRFEDSVKDDGFIFINSSITSAKTKFGTKVFYVPADDIAYEIGSKKVANIVMLGAYMAKIGVLSQEAFEAVLSEKLEHKPELLAMNRQALKKGAEAL
ncbi:MAG: 2-oxoacid:acceptor oxidoreductase family protein [Peptostreptococcaceae bacterium]|nr:2-oxoacid:acceptor oxidoreductase family protein [Peptostreptococcaceae bacterium]